MHHGYPEGLACQRLRLNVDLFPQTPLQQNPKAALPETSPSSWEPGLWDVRAPHLQHAGQVAGHALHQHAVGPQLGALPARHVAVALTDQEPHLLHGGARVHVVAESLVDRRLPVVETGERPRT